MLDQDVRSIGNDFNVKYLMVTNLVHTITASVLITVRRAVSEERAKERVGRIGRSFTLAFRRCGPIVAVANTTMMHHTRSCITLLRDRNNTPNYCSSGANFFQQPKPRYNRPGRLPSPNKIDFLINVLTRVSTHYNVFKLLWSTFYEGWRSFTTRFAQKHSGSYGSAITHLGCRFKRYSSHPQDFSGERNTSLG